MTVELEVDEKRVRVKPCAKTMGGAGPLDYVVFPGEAFRGWSFKKLRRKGSGTHVLLTKSQKHKAKPTLNLRGTA